MNNNKSVRLNCVHYTQISTSNPYSIPQQLNPSTGNGLLASKQQDPKNVPQSQVGIELQPIPVIVGDSQSSYSQSIILVSVK